MNKQSSTEIKKNIMGKLKKNEIKMKARWTFLAKKIGLQSGVWLALVLLIFLVNAFFYFIKSNGLLLPLHYGESYIQKFFHSLPYDLILIILVLFLILNFLVKKFDFSYKKPFIIVLGGLLGFIILWAFLLFSSNFNAMLKVNLQNTEKNIPYIKNFYLNRCGCGCGGMHSDNGKVCTELNSPSCR
ncbi:MAG: hypothetical protein GF347_01505 [Candidatus Moranbacteria bacterium]|nr:hypothetical protein [Candidatus Moranbacteria bacterium]